MIRISPSALLASLTLGIAGCDTFSGVTRTYNLESTIEYDCVESVLARHPRVAGFVYTRETGGRALTWGGIEEPEQIHRFSYQLTATDSWPSFYFVERHDGAIEYRHTVGCYNCTPPQEEVDRFRPFMLEVEQRLEESCSLTGITRGATEYCRKVDCTPAE